MVSAAVSLFVAGAAVLALWIDARFPRLAPPSFSQRVLAACVAFLILKAVPIRGGSAAAAYTTLFALVLPAFVATFLTAAWLVRALRDAHR